MLRPLDTPTPPTASCRRRPPWELLGEQRLPLLSITVQANIHLPGDPWKLLLPRIAQPRPIPPAFHLRRGGQCRAPPSTTPPATSTPSSALNRTLDPPRPSPARSRPAKAAGLAGIGKPAPVGRHRGCIANFQVFPGPFLQKVTQIVELNC
jgi:hypothetical protein